MESSDFDFKKKEHLILTVDENVVLHLKQITNSTCVLYFKETKEKQEEHVIVPKDVVVYDTVFNEKHVMSHPIPSRKYYYLSWAENYLVKYKSEIILTMYNPRVWDIHVNIPTPKTI